MNKKKKDTGNETVRSVRISDADLDDVAAILGVKTLSEVIKKSFDVVRANHKAGIAMITPEPTTSSDDVSEDAPKRVILRTTMTREHNLPYPYKRFMLPVGEVVYTTHGYSMRTWACAPEKLDYVRELCKPWVENGFTLYEGEPYDEHHTKPLGYYCPSSKMVVIYKGFVDVWMDIEDADKALRFMEKNTDIPVALEVDGWRYTDDEYYRAAVDKASELFIHYFRTGKPKTTTVNYEELMLADL